MSDFPPTVRHLIPCDDVRQDPTTPRVVTLVNVVHALQASGTPPYPARHPELCVFVLMTECRGEGRFQVRVVDADTWALAFANRERTLRFPGNPLEVHGVAFRIQECPFPRPGLYLVQLWYDGRMILAEQPILLR
ncbi:MAG TPA: hypothetical protein VIL46_02885 [Gemmataceae bacterium]